MKIEKEVAQRTTITIPPEAMEWLIERSRITGASLPAIIRILVRDAVLAERAKQKESKK